MKYFLKLNVLSIFYALMMFIPLELMLNVYRINRITNWEIDTVNTWIGITVMVEMVVGTVLLYYFIKKWMEGRKALFWTVILWLPYFLLFVYLIANLFPITYGGDTPNPVTGLLAIGMLIIFPIYIFILNFVAGPTVN